MEIQPVTTKRASVKMDSLFLSAQQSPRNSVRGVGAWETEKR